MTTTFIIDVTEPQLLAEARLWIPEIQAKRFQNLRSELKDNRVTLPWFLVEVPFLGIGDL